MIFGLAASISTSAADFKMAALLPASGGGRAGGGGGGGREPCGSTTVLSATRAAALSRLVWYAEERALPRLAWAGAGPVGGGGTGKPDVSSAEVRIPCCAARRAKYSPMLPLLSAGSPEVACATCGFPVAAARACRAEDIQDGALCPSPPEPDAIGILGKTGRAETQRMLVLGFPPCGGTEPDEPGSEARTTADVC